MPPGPKLEIGSGIGVAQDFISDLTTSDIVHTRFVDRAENAYAMSAIEGGWSGILAIDVLHHLRDPMRFLVCSAEVLRSGGRLVLVEPAATPYSLWLYRSFHSEPIDPSVLQPPFVIPKSEEDEFANMGMASALFEDHADWTKSRLAEWGMVVRLHRYRDVFAYPLTGGFSGRQWAPFWAIKMIRRIEHFLPQWFLQTVGLRTVVVLEKTK